MWQSLVFPNMTAGAICWHPRAVNANVVSCLGRGRLCQYFPSRFPGAGGGTDGLALDFDSPVGGGPEAWWGDCPSGGPSRKMFVGLACPQAPHRTVPYPTTSPVYPSWRAPCLASPLQVFRTKLLTCSSKLSLETLKSLMVSSLFRVACVMHHICICPQTALAPRCPWHPGQSWAQSACQLTVFRETGTGGNRGWGGGLPRDGSSAKCAGQPLSARRLGPDL